MLEELDKKSPVILIVDDQVNNVRLLGEAIKDLGEIHFATSGEAALVMAHRIYPDIVLLDIEMPGMSGLEVCKALKSMSLPRDPRIIFVTGHGEPETELNALEEGGVDFITKPINIPIARARVQIQLLLLGESRRLAIARDNLKDVIQYLPAFVAYWNTELKNLFCNDIAGDWFGLTATEMLGRHIRDIGTDELFERLQLHLRAVMNGKSSTFDIQFDCEDGRIRYGHATLVARKLGGEVVGFLLLLTDITERRHMEMALFDEKERLRVTLSSIGDAVIATDPACRVTFMNPIAEDLTGWQAQEAIGQAIEIVMPLIDHSGKHPIRNPLYVALKEDRVVGMALNSALKRRDEKVIDVEDSAAPIKDMQGVLSGGIIVFHDVSESRAMALKMTHLAHHDALTNLPNRMLLLDRTDQAIRKAGRKSESVAMILLDVDNFKTINDTLGHNTGDELLVQLAGRLTQASRSVDTVCRQGGDEFIILMPEITQIEGVSHFAERLLDATSKPFTVGEHRLDLSISIGISLYPQDSQDMESLYRHADSAMFQAKHEGKNRFRFFSSEIEHALNARHYMEQHMRNTLLSGKFEVYYQVKVHTQAQRIEGVEALIRWNSAERGAISPAEFIPIAEETGLIIPIGQFVLERACQDAFDWLQKGMTIPVSVNISATQFREETFVDNVKAVLIKTGLPAELLELEITEGVLARDVEGSKKTLCELRAMGVSISIDDFGTGYSSLAYLKQFPINVLKIDRSFVNDMLSENNSKAIVDVIIRLGLSLGMKLVAEGVETTDQLMFLQSKECFVVQGFLYSKPLPLRLLTPKLTEIIIGGKPIVSF